MLNVNGEVLKVVEEGVGGKRRRFQGWVAEGKKRYLYCLLSIGFLFIRCFSDGLLDFLLISSKGLVQKSQERGEKVSFCFLVFSAAIPRSF